MFFVFNSVGECITHFLTEEKAYSAATLASGFYTTKFSATSREYAKIEAYEKALFAKSEQKVTSMTTVPADPYHDAKRIYGEFVDKSAALAPHVAYCRKVAKATSGTGRTPVEPLATMGTDGGPLLCDHCGKPMILEGGEFHGKTADVAWKLRPIPGWTSYILGGMVVETVTNGTLRIYHGHTHGQPGECATVANLISDKAMSQWSNKELIRWCGPVTAFVRDKMPEVNTVQFVNTVLNTVFGYDPGIGVNRPS